MTSRAQLFASLAPLCALACSESRPPDARTAVADSVITIAPPPAMDVDSSAPAAVTRAKLAWEGEGLRLFLEPSGAARPVPFGRPMAEVIATLTAVQGSDGGTPPVQLENADCGAIAATWASTGLTAWFARQRFVGWSVQPPAQGTALTTASGIGLGSTRTELEGAYAADVARSTLGIEFSAGGLAGLLDSARPDARVVNLWAGQACLGR